MARIPYADPAKLSPAVKKSLETMPFNVTRMLAGASEGVFHGFGAFGSAFYSGTTLSPVLREIAILRVGYMLKSQYETFQHEALAKHLKMTQAQIDAIKAGQASDSVFNSTEQAVMNLATDLVKNTRASDATLAALRKHLPDNLVIDLILLIGLYMTVCCLLETTGVDLDQSPIGWSSMDLTKDSISKAG